jgi:hypothetical protein
VERASWICRVLKGEALPEERLAAPLLSPFTLYYWRSVESNRVLTESAKIGYEGVELNMGERGELNVFKITDADVKRVKEEDRSRGVRAVYNLG